MRHTDRRQRYRRRGRTAYDRGLAYLGGERRARRRRHRRAAARGRRRHHRQDQHARVRLRRDLRAHAQPLGPCAHPRRVERRLGGGARRRHGHGRDRHRYRRVDPLAQRALRRRRPQAHLRPGRAPRRHPAELVARPCRANGAHGRRRRAAARRHGAGGRGKSKGKGTRQGYARARRRRAGPARAAGHGAESRRPTPLFLRRPGPGGRGRGRTSLARPWSLGYEGMPGRVARRRVDLRGRTRRATS